MRPVLWSNGFPTSDEQQARAVRNRDRKKCFCPSFVVEIRRVIRTWKLIEAEIILTKVLESRQLKCGCAMKFHIINGIRGDGKMKKNLKRHPSER